MSSTLKRYGVLTILINVAWIQLTVTKFRLESTQSFDDPCFTFSFCTSTNDHVQQNRILKKRDGAIQRLQIYLAYTTIACNLEMFLRTHGKCHFRCVVYQIIIQFKTVFQAWLPTAGLNKLIFKVNLRCLLINRLKQFPLTKNNFKILRF